MAIVITSIFFIIIGLALGGGGLWLVTLGGSVFYLFAGLMFLITAGLLLMRKAVALWVYAVLVVAALAWAIWEVGFDWWQLGPRGGMIILLGLWLLTPWIRRPLGLRSPTGITYAANPWPLAVPVILAIRHAAAEGGIGGDRIPRQLAGKVM
ncbi:hypothetical protein ACCS39_01615, partial [Rhizobium ruizarguesonis]